MEVLPVPVEAAAAGGTVPEEAGKAGAAMYPSGSMYDDDGGGSGGDDGEEDQCDCGGEEEGGYCEQEDPFTGRDDTGQDGQGGVYAQAEVRSNDGEAEDGTKAPEAAQVEVLWALAVTLCKARRACTASPTARGSRREPKTAALSQEKAANHEALLAAAPEADKLEEAMEAFFGSDFSVAPQFTYALPEEYVAQQFQENSHVCFELLPEARRILQRVQDEYGGPESFMQRLNGDEKVPAEVLQKTVAAYLQDHNVEDKVEVRIVDSLLSAANVVKPSPDEKYLVNINRGPVSRGQVRGICDHEVGTHLLRMMNDEHQAWHGQRGRYKLANPWTTEEGFATVNTYISMPCKLLYPQAFRYFAVCRGAQLGFVELFREIQAHVRDPKRCWQMCCRIKRGMTDTSLPGAFYMDQAYFKGAVEILRHLDEVDFGRLYGGQIALQDLDKVHFVLRKEVVRLPHFLNSTEKLKTYMAHCRRLIKENQIENVIERVCKPIFVRTAREFFKQKATTKKLCTMTIGFGAPPSNADNSPSPNRPLDLGRLENLARPRQASLERDVAEPDVNKRRNLDLVRIASLSMPRCRVETEETVPPASENERRRDVNRARLLELARPRAEVEPEGALPAAAPQQQQQQEHEQQEHEQ
eukprot:CAMPEP_0179354104 /NCGR_PEP_ID=MMETSP0797-20121207/76677_1 /TAXON_ID=47934 /ORGANISM="Dinophysis acuminata, Strain DAEP01" /LENGTH=639 /DNA_ID=CAMNT_0021069193 /DNA_START=141 /DNA_END=2060 /DNA_ORIENTATION=-